MLGLIARKVIANPWKTIAVWAIGVVLIIFFSPNLADYTTGNQQSFLPTSFESVKAQSAGAEFFPADQDQAGTLVAPASAQPPPTSNAAPAQP